VSGEQNVLGFIDPRRGENRPFDTGAQALYHASTRLADVQRGAPRFKTKDLVGLLLSHGARTWRCTMPVARIRIRVFAPDGKPAIKLGLSKRPLSE
jgi:hypothetical protein